MHRHHCLFILLTSLLLQSGHLFADVSRIEILRRETLQQPGTSQQYEAIHGVLHYTLDPLAAGNQQIVDLALAPANSAGLVTFSADFTLLVPRAGTVSDTLLYQVNNRGRSTLPPQDSLQHPLSTQGHTWLVTGWINELAEGDDRLRLHAPIAAMDKPQARIRAITAIFGERRAPLPPVGEAKKGGLKFCFVRQGDNSAGGKRCLLIRGGPIHAATLPGDNRDEAMTAGVAARDKAKSAADTPAQAEPEPERAGGAQ
jgi:hypothetical protein